MCSDYLMITFDTSYCVFKLAFAFAISNKIWRLNKMAMKFLVSFDNSSCQE